MSYISDFQDGVSDVLKLGGKVRIKYYDVNITDGYYDDDATLQQSGGDLWISGLVLPITQGRGSNDAILIEQGKVLTNDSKLYIQGNINTSGTIRIGVGSPIIGEYSIINEGVTLWSVNETPIIKKLYIRKLPIGSLIGEV